VHTNNGIVGVHYGYAPNFEKTSINVVSELYTGLPYYLQKNGYATMCFVTGNPQYDNMNSFWHDNHIEDIYSLYDYPQDKAVNNFGVQDGYMFEWGLNKLNDISMIGKPFFASFLTVSNHGPFIVPDQYKNRAEELSDCAVAYSDDAIRHFMEEALSTEWGKNTIFILVADHGTIYIPHIMYDMPLSYNYIPVFIYSDLLEPQQISRPTSQMDIWPTVLSMLGIEYENNSLGIDIFSDERKYAFFCGNEHLGVSDGQWFWCYNLQSKLQHLYQIGDPTDVSDLYPEQAAQMREYGMKMQRINLLAIEKKWTEPSK
jgi:phosphoglycerol transferase MdoB-like AlkP superfamily enzyme